MQFKTKPVNIPVNKEKLSGILFIPDAAGRKLLPSIVIFHGRGSSKKRYIDRGRALAKNGFLTLVFDFRGCGKSDGKFVDQTIARGFEDAVAGYDYLTAQSLCDKNKIGVFGGSFGGYQAALLTEKRIVASLILAAPAIYQDQWWDKIPEIMDLEEKALYRRQSEFHNTKAMLAIQKYSGPILIIQHEKDEIVPHRVTQAYYDNAINASLREKQIIPNAPHAIHKQNFLKQSTNIIATWFLKTLT